jgi:hypothetical protein
MFLARRVVFRTVALLITLSIVMASASFLRLLTSYGKLVLGCALWIVASLIPVGVLVTCYYVFRVGLREAGVKYAIGHLLLCASLSFMLLLGIVFVPLLVGCDVDRWRRWEDESARGSAE